MKSNISSVISITADKIAEIYKKKGSVYIAIDGNCGAGKTTLAKQLAELFNCNLFNMDDFYLTPQKRTPDRLSEPGGNVDRERFLEEVLIPLSNNEDVFYRVYDCKTQSFKEPVKITPKKVVITEGSYSCHPELFDYYDLHIFLSVSPGEQMKRIISRNGETDAQNFKNKWIPLEEKYFKEFKIKDKCELSFEIN